MMKATALNRGETERVTIRKPFHLAPTTVKAPKAESKTTGQRKLNAKTKSNSLKRTKKPNNDQSLIEIASVNEYLKSTSYLSKRQIKCLAQVAIKWLVGISPLETALNTATSKRLTTTKSLWLTVEMTETKVECLC